VSQTHSPSGYPAFLSISGARALVIGAGRVAERKITGLLRDGAIVTVVAPLASPRVRQWAAAGKLQWRSRKFRLVDLRGQRLVFCATDHADVDQAAAQAARRSGLLVNCSSAPELGNFVLPAVARSGQVQVAVSTGGASPALARRLSADFGRELKHADAWAALLREFRREIIERVPRARQRKLWDDLTSEVMARLIQGGKPAEARRMMRNLIERAANVRSRQGHKNIR
jgi:precorrin-2 dehydrogenase/sirohydrochlorin ferrochelatase